MEMEIEGPIDTVLKFVSTFGGIRSNGQTHCDSSVYRPFR